MGILVLQFACASFVFRVLHSKSLGFLISILSAYRLLCGTRWTVFTPPFCVHLRHDADNGRHRTRAPFFFYFPLFSMQFRRIGNLFWVGIGCSLIFWLPLHLNVLRQPMPWTCPVFASN